MGFLLRTLVRLVYVVVLAVAILGWIGAAAGAIEPMDNPVPLGIEPMDNPIIFSCCF